MNYSVNSLGKQVALDAADMAAAATSSPPLAETLATETAPGIPKAPPCTVPKPPGLIHKSDVPSGHTYEKYRSYDPNTPAPSAPKAVSIEPDMYCTALTLTDEHRAHLKLSSLTDETIDASGIKSATGPQLSEFGFDPAHGSSMVIPYPSKSLVTNYRIRPDDTKKAFAEDGAKYLAAAGSTPVLYTPIAVSDIAQDVSVPLLVAEGEKKALAALQAGHMAVGVPGVYGWMSGGKPIEDLKRFKWKDRDVVVCYDSDVRENEMVQDALRRLVCELELRHARVKVVMLPEGEDGSKQGVDDYIVANGPEAFTKLVESAGPLVDAALTLVEPGFTPRTLQLIVDFVSACIASYPASRDMYTAILGQTMEKHGYGKQSRRTLSSGITQATKLIKNQAAGPRSEECPEDVAAAYLADEQTVEINSAKLRTLHLVNGQLYMFEANSVYREITAEDLKRDITRWLQGNKSQITTHVVANVCMNVKAMIELDSDTEIPSWVDGNTDKTNDWMAFEGGLVNMRSVLNAIPGVQPQFENHTPAFLTTSIMPFHFSQHATCPIWDNFLAQTFADDPKQILRLQEWVGAHLDLIMDLEKFALFVGEGANGKSVVLNVLAALIGILNVVSIQLDNLGDKFQTGRLRGKVANIVADLEDTDKAAEGILKRVVSREILTGEHKNQPPFTFVSRARHTFSTNVFPRFRDKSNGVWRRLLLFVFNNVVAEADQDTKLASKIIAAELPGIFNWALIGTKRLQKTGRFTESDICTKEADRYRNDCDPVRSFLDEHCQISANAECDCAALYDSYQDYCHQNGYRALSKNQFGRNLTRSVPSLARYRPTEAGNRTYRYRGVSLVTCPPARPGSERRRWRS